jgi:hypothetical protein
VVFASRVSKLFHQNVARDPIRHNYAASPLRWKYINFVLYATYIDGGGPRFLRWQCPVDEVTACFDVIGGVFPNLG